MRSERFEMRLEPDIANAVDTWRDARMPGASRSHAIRALIGYGLQNGLGRFSDGEKTLIALLGDLSRHLNAPLKKIDGLIKGFSSGNHWAADELMGALYSEPLASIDDARFTSQVLEMWCFFEESFERLSPGDKAKVLMPSEGEQAILDEGAQPTQRKVFFSGFSASEPNLVSAAKFLIDDLGQFLRFRERNLSLVHEWSREDEVERLNFYEQLKSKLGGPQVAVSEIREFSLTRAAMPVQEFLALNRKQRKTGDL